MTEQKINKLLKKYRYNFPLCEFCGGRVIRDREWVCSVCGMVQEKIHEPKGKNPNVNTTESKVRKYRRESEWDKKLHKKKLNKNKFATVEISRGVKILLSKYMKGRAIYQYQFLNEIILKAISEDKDDKK